MQDLELPIIKADLAAAQDTVNSLNSSAIATTASIQNLGAPASKLAVASFRWADLSLSDDPSFPMLTNAQCAVVAPALATQTDFQSKLRAELLRVLPSSPAGFVFTSNISCGPAISLQTRPDQQAFFTVDLQITAPYTLFSAAMTNIVLPVGINPALLFPETIAPLGNKNLRGVIQNALRRAFLVIYQETLSTFSGPHSLDLHRSVASHICFRCV